MVASFDHDLSSRYGKYYQHVIEKFLSVNKVEEKNNSFLGLPYACNYALVDDLENIDALAGIWGTNYLAIHLLDKIEDEELDKDLFQSHSNGALINLSIALMIASLTVLDLPGVCPNEKLRFDFRTQITSTLLGMSNAQHLDLSREAETVTQCWEIVGAKSGLFFKLGCYLGVRMATDNKEILNAFMNYGYHLGVIVQIANDIAGLWKKDHSGDICTGMKTLPIVYAREYYSEQNNPLFEKLLSEAKGSSESEQAARKMLIASGAIIYLCLEAENHKKAAISAITSVQSQLRQPQLLIEMVENTFQSHEILPSQAGY